MTTNRNQNLARKGTPSTMPAEWAKGLVVNRHEIEQKTPPHEAEGSRELVVNWHVLEQCNYDCSYCYAKYDAENSVCWDRAYTSQILKELLRLPEVVQGEWNGIRLNIAGGEPLLLKERLIEIFKEAGQLGFRLSIISNGSLPDRIDSLLCEAGQDLCMLGISMDSADPETNKLIGRKPKSNSSKHVLTPERLRAIYKLARSMNPSIVCKLNTVVNKHNLHRDGSRLIMLTQPDRWKIFKALYIPSPYGSQGMEIFKVTDEQFHAYVNRHKGRVGKTKIYGEDNDDMMDSYLMVDPKGRLCQYSELTLDGRMYSDPIHEGGIKKAFQQITFQPKKFEERYIPLKQV